MELMSFSILSVCQVYGIFYATSFLDLYRNPKSLTTSLHNKTVIVSRDEQYLFLVSFPYWGVQRSFYFFKDGLNPGLLAQTLDPGSWRYDSRIRVCARGWFLFCKSIRFLLEEQNEWPGNQLQLCGGLGTWKMDKHSQEWINCFRRIPLPGLGT